ncbi:helix-turn-helix transcriptional regulator, partial [Glaesserella parasuis]
MLYPEGKPGAKPIGEKMAHHILHKFVLPLDWFNRDYDDEGELIPFEEPSIVIDVLNVEASAGNGSTGDLVEIVSKLHYVPEQFYLYFRGIDPENIRVINIKGDS